MLCWAPEEAGMVHRRRLGSAGGVVAASSLGLALLACRGGEGVKGAPTGAGQEGVVSEAADVPTADRSIESRLEQFVRETNVVGGRRAVKFDLRNASAGTLSFRYTIEWLDRNGEPIPDPQRRWIPLALPANTAASLEIEAPSPRALSWRLRAAPARGG